MTIDVAPEPARAEHASHTFRKGPRWRECSRCRTREHWPAASAECSAVDVDAEVYLGSAIDAILADLAAFETWWRGRADLGVARPSFAEWRAEFFEWSRANGASAR